MAVYPLAPGTRLYETRASPGYRFRVERPLGQGGFGITYLAYDVEFAGPCVVKELALDELCARSDSTGHLTVAPGRGDDFSRWLERFESEGRQIHRIDHPNVVRVRAVWRERGTAYYAMDLVEGALELPRPEQHGWQPMPWSRAEPIARAILSALQAVHGHGLIHGDVKPSNVLVDQRGRPVLIDFGTVRTQDELRRTVTSTMFTPGYAPPELTSFDGVRAAGAWSDLYSWAMVLWGLVARHPGLEGRPIDATTRLLVRQTGGADPYVQSAGALRHAGLPEAWVDSVLSCLRPETELRPASVEAMLRVLDARTGSVPHTVPRDAQTRAGSATKRGQTSAVSDLAVVSVPQITQADNVEAWTDEDTSPSVSEKRRRRSVAASLGAVSVVLLFSVTFWALRPSPHASSASVPPDMVLIRAGTFTMGSPVDESGRDDDERQHTVTLTRDFFLSSTEVTQGQWNTLMPWSPTRFSECGDNCPVEQVSWEDAVRYANARSRAEGLPKCYHESGRVVDGDSVYDCRGYRLPTEAEWEYAARAGSTGAMYGTEEIAWTADNAGLETHPVGGKSPNPWGLYDMLGNVWEWTHDWYGGYPAGAVTDPAGAASESYRIIRGCSWFSYIRECRVADRRSASGPRRRLDGFGFRLARTAP